MAKQPQHRYPSAGDLADAARHALEHRPTQTTPGTARPPRAGHTRVETTHRHTPPQRPLPATPQPVPEPAVLESTVVDRPWADPCGPSEAPRCWRGCRSGLPWGQSHGQARPMWHPAVQPPWLVTAHRLGSGTRSRHHSEPRRPTPSPDTTPTPPGHRSDPEPVTDCACLQRRGRLPRMTRPLIWHPGVSGRLCKSSSRARGLGGWWMLFGRCTDRYITASQARQERCPCRPGTVPAHQYGDQPTRGPGPGSGRTGARPDSAPGRSRRARPTAVAAACAAAPRPCRRRGRRRARWSRSWSRSRTSPRTARLRGVVASRMLPQGCGAGPAPRGGHAGRELRRLGGDLPEHR